MIKGRLRTFEYPLSPEADDGGAPGNIECDCAKNVLNKFKAEGGRVMRM